MSTDRYDFYLNPTKRFPKRMLHVETSLGIINITIGLTDRKGREVVSIETIPQKYAGENKVVRSGFGNTRLIRLKSVIVGKEKPRPRLKRETWIITDAESAEVDRGDFSALGREDKFLYTAPDKMELKVWRNRMIWSKADDSLLIGYETTERRQAAAYAAEPEEFTVVGSNSQGCRLIEVMVSKDGKAIRAARPRAVKVVV